MFFAILRMFNMHILLYFIYLVGRDTSRFRCDADSIPGKFCWARSSYRRPQYETCPIESRHCVSVQWSAAARDSCQEWLDAFGLAENGYEREQTAQGSVRAASQRVPWGIKVGGQRLPWADADDLPAEIAGRWGQIFFLPGCNQRQWR